MIDLTTKSMMQNLINKRFYASKEIAITKLNFFFAVNELNGEDYTDLILLTNNVYVEVTEETENTESVQEDNTEATQTTENEV